MAIHDDVDDANDANDKTSSEHEFDLLGPKPAGSNTPAAGPTDNATDPTPADATEYAPAEEYVDLIGPSDDGVYDLDAALKADSSPQVPTSDTPDSSVSSSGSAPIDLNDEFQRSDVAAGLDRGMPPWAMAPAPDPTQAVPRIDVPEGLSEEQRAAVSDPDDDGVTHDLSSTSAATGQAPSSAAGDEDPYQIPVDYTTPDYFASRISRRRVSNETAGEPTPTFDEAGAFHEPAIVHNVDEPVTHSDEPDSDGGSPSFFAEEQTAPSAENSSAPASSDANAVPEEDRPFKPRQSFIPPRSWDETTQAPSQPVVPEQSVFDAPQLGAAGPVEEAAPATKDAPAASDAAPADQNAAAAENATGDGTPLPPARRSMADEELLMWADNPANQSTGALSVIEVLEAQLRLREEEAREYREWETTFRSGAGPATDQLSNQAAANDGGAESDDSVVDEAPQAPQRDGTGVTPEAPQPALPAWDVPPPSDTWSPAEEFDDEIPFAAHADPTGSITLPDVAAGTSDSIPRVDDGAATSPEFAPSAELPTAAENIDSAPAPVAPEPQPTAADEPEPGVSQFSADAGLPSLDDVLAAREREDVPWRAQDGQAETGAPDTHASPELPADEDGDYDEVAFAPPPLVEPDVAPNIPRANLEEHVSFGDFGFAPPVSDVPHPADVPPPAEAENSAPFSFGLNVDSASGDVDTPDNTSAGTPADKAELDTPAASVDREPKAADSETATDGVPSGFSFASPQNPRYVAPEALSFDDLLKPSSDDESPDSDDSTSTGTEQAHPFDAFLGEQEAASQVDPLATVQTGSVPISQHSPEQESDDVVDDVIPFAAGAAALGGTAVAGGTLAGDAPSPAADQAPFGQTPTTDASALVPQPVAHSKAVVAQQPLDLDEVAPTAQRVFSLEQSGLEPTPVDRRVGHAARLFWLWFAANSSILSIGLGAAVFAVGMSLRQSIVSVLAGVALSFIPLGLTTLAGRRSGQPTMVISRSAFGLLGNIAPAAIALIARLFWGAVLLWLLASSVAIVLIGSDLGGGLGDRQLLLIALALSFLIALVIAFAGYPLFARVQLILSILSGILVVGLIVFTAEFVDISQALTTPDGSWLLTITGAVLVFSFLGLVWAHSGADLARYQRPSSNGPASMLSASFGAALPAFALIAYGALLAASDPALARGFLASPLDTLLMLLPAWYPLPLLFAAVLSLLSGITLSLYSGGFALQAMGIRLPRQWAIVVVAVLLGALAILFAFGVDGGINELFRDVATTLAVPTAAWAGIFASETMIRTRKLDSAALLNRGGAYADVRWVNLGAFVVISAIGFALTSATISWLSWQGYGFAALGVESTSELAATDMGVLVALALGLLTPIVLGIPAIRRQEAEYADRAPRPA